jgi:hypothetical protein
MIAALERPDGRLGDDAGVGQSSVGEDIVFNEER